MEGLNLLEDSDYGSLGGTGERFIAIGIDFGTTYSGVSFASSVDPETIEVITTWDEANGQEKVPSRIAFESLSTVHWGNDIPADIDALSWFKLLLVDPKNLSEDVRGSDHIDTARKRLSKSRQDAVTVVAAYLKQLWRHTLAELNKRYDELAVQHQQFKVYLTVPAIWDEKACQLMRKAATQAGICARRADVRQTELRLVSEPEAAALAVFGEYKGQHQVNPGDVFIVCDAGGGTVDLVSYEVEKTEPMQVKEFVKGEGGMCGAIFIDEQFENQVKRALGKRWTNMHAAARKRIFDTQWENGIKRNFDGREHEYQVAVPADIFSTADHVLKRTSSKKGDVPMKKGQLILTSGHIRPWFNKVLQQISSMIRHQIAGAEQKGQKPKSILLVGGFGASKYLYSRLKDEFGPKGISVLQPAGPRGWSAISRGAVIKALSDAFMDAGIEYENMAMISSRISRVSYGISVRRPWNAVKHDPADKQWDEEEGVWKATNQMNWYLRVGDNIDEKDPLNLDYYRLLRQPRLTEHIPILRNREDEPPTRVTDRVDTFVTIKIPMGVDYNQLPTRSSAKDGFPLRKLTYTIGMLTNGTSVSWQLRIKGVLQGEEAFEIEED